MVGGRVVEVAEIPKRPGILWINCIQWDYSRPEYCSVLCELNEDSKHIEIGDSVWWQSGHIMWTPVNKSRVDVKIKKIGGSGVTYETACANS
jgi:hypothetical protein